MSVRITGKHPKQITGDIKRAINITIPRKVKQIGLKHFDDSFAKQGWTGGVYLSWKSRKSRNKKNSGRSIMIGTGRLRRSIRGVESPQRVTFSTDVEYAQIHNDGGVIQKNAMSKLYIQNRKKRGVNKGQFTKGTTKGKGLTTGAYTIKMPKRQFMGASTKLLRDLTTMIDKEFINAIK